MINIPIGLRLYRIASAMVRPFAPLIMILRARSGKEERSRASERRGIPTRARPPGHLVWLHGASVGESISLLPIIYALTERKFSVLVTSGTITSARVLERRMPPGALHQYIPIDLPAYVENFFEHWRPDLAILAESELWPNLVLEAHQRKIPLVLANARMSDKSFKRWSQMKGAARAILSRLDVCLAQTQLDAERLSKLGAPSVTVAGNLKFDVEAPPASPIKLSALKGLIGGRPVWLAASTHPGEDAIILAAHQHLKRRVRGILTIIAPRHPERGRNIATLATRSGFHSALRSSGLVPDATTDVYIADTIGEMGLLYRLAPIVFMGGSLVPHGGQNPIEPAKLGAALIHGPHIENFQDIYTALDRDGGSITVRDANTLAECVLGMIAQPSEMRLVARASADTVARLGGALDRTMSEIAPYLVKMHLGEDS
jgi:3-deoxy-D-manno-octulosonic-acid transferase